MSTHTNDSANVLQLRVIVEAEDFDAAIAFYRDTLGLPEQVAFGGDGDARVSILDVLTGAEFVKVNEATVCRAAGAFDAADRVAFCR
ncbi:hypothetical protein [Cryobacterium sp. Sr8]|uniref:hypothetical protein n=1 Tax=Cryobacterium sp. Sr8 TaxID=1259203 RepID=UPI0018E0AA31|nr:hypothetical protein [Cryobacterium sp. Sr8]